MNVQARCLCVLAAITLLSDRGFVVAQSAPIYAPGTSINTNIRPIVSLQYSGASNLVPAARRVAIGILDTGDPQETLSRDTAHYLGIPATTPLGPAGGTNSIGTTAVQNVTSAGWLGGTIDGLEQMVPAAPPDPQVRAGDPAHAPSNFLIAPGGIATANGVQPYYADYNGRFSENHTSSAFLSQPNPNNNLVAFIDPTNATPLPFSYDNVTGGNGRGLAGAGNPLDMLASSVSYFANGTARVPNQTRNANPGFVHFVSLTPTEWTSSTLTPAPAISVQNNALPAGVNRRLTLNVAPANVAAVVGVIPTNYAGLDPGYVPANAALAAIPTVSTLLEVRNNTPLGNLNIGGLPNAAGFQQRNGAVQVRVVNNATGAVVMTQNITLPTQAPQPFGTINIPALGINTGAARLLDSGGINTSASLVGTTVLNRFGQYWDYSPNGTIANPNLGLLTLIGPSNPGVLNMLGAGLLFAVDGTTVGQTQTAVNHERTIGTIPQLNGGNAAGNITLAGDGIANQATGTIFRSHLTGSNATYIDEAALGLTRGAAGDVINAKSLGADRIAQRGDVFFSVDRNVSPTLFSTVGIQSTRAQVAADIFHVRGQQLTNARPDILLNNIDSALFINQEVMGLSPFIGPGASNLTAGAPDDNLIALDMQTGAALPGTPGVGGSLSNLDFPITAPNQAALGGRNRFGPELLTTNFDVYFSLEGDKDILRSNGNNVFARGLEDIGLVQSDDIDALALFRPSVTSGVIGGVLDPGDVLLSPDLVRNDLFGEQTLVFDPNPARNFQGIDMFHGGGMTDLAIFSLAPNSPSLGGFIGNALSPADLFVTDFDGSFSLYATAESLGLFFGDNLDALDVIPEPSSCLLLLCGVLVLLFRGQRGRAKFLPTPIGGSQPFSAAKVD